MGTPARRPIGPVVAPALADLILVGTLHNEALAQSLKQTFAGARSFLELTALQGDETARLAIGLFDPANQDTVTPFARWAQAARTPALNCIVDGGDVLIGPLAVPQRAGCSRCAWERLAAAASAGPQEHR